MTLTILQVLWTVVIIVLYASAVIGVVTFIKDFIRKEL